MEAEDAVALEATHCTLPRPCAFRDDILEKASFLQATIYHFLIKAFHFDKGSDIGKAAKCPGESQMPFC